MKQTKMTVSEAREAVKEFIKVFGAGIIALVLMILAGMGSSPGIVLVTAILIALDKYFKEKGIYVATAKKVGLMKK